MQDRRLDSAKKIRQFLAWISNRLMKDEMDLAKARTLGYLQQISLRAVEASDFEDRLNEIERRLEAMETKDLNHEEPLA